MLARVLNYFAQTGSETRILVLDSSSDPARQRNLVNVTRFGAGLEIRLLHLNDTYLSKCSRGLKRVETPYAVLCPDDAFLLSMTLANLVAFLERHDGYSAASGISVGLNRGPDEKCYALPGRPVLSDSPVVRFRDVAGNSFQVANSVQRTDVMQRGFEIAAAATSFEQASALSDILLNQMPVLQGRIHFVPAAAHVRLQRLKNQHLGLQPVCVERSATHYQNFRDALVEQLEIAGATIEHAVIMVDRYYSDLCTGVAWHPRRPGISAKVRRETIRHYRQLVNLVRSDYLLQRRRLRRSDLARQEQEWRLIQDLMNQTATIPLDAEQSEFRRAA
jgi:glycosyltransferase domain-containing protein